MAKRDTPVRDAIAMVQTAGGVCVLAHPFATRRGPTVTAAVIESMADAGLDGVEVDHPDHAADDRARLRMLAADRGLLVTGSSDYHGANKVNRLGEETTDPAMLERLVATASGARVCP